jgi:hypothetical protein
MIIRPSLRKRWRRYKLVEFDVPGHVNVKRYRVDKLGSQLREAKRISDTRFPSTRYPNEATKCGDISQSEGRGVHQGLDKASVTSTS